MTIVARELAPAGLRSSPKTGNPASTTRPTRLSLRAQPSQGRRPLDGGFFLLRGDRVRVMAADYTHFIHTQQEPAKVCVRRSCGHNGDLYFPPTLKDLLCAGP